MPALEYVSILGKNVRAIISQITESTIVYLFILSFMNPLKWCRRYERYTHCNIPTNMISTIEKTIKQTKYKSFFKI